MGLGWHLLNLTAWSMLRNWWGGMQKHLLNLTAWSMLRHWWGGVGVASLELDRMVDATQLMGWGWGGVGCKSISWTWPHGRCYATDGVGCKSISWTWPHGRCYATDGVGCKSISWTWPHGRCYATACTGIDCVWKRVKEQLPGSIHTLVNKKVNGLLWKRVRQWQWRNANRTKCLLFVTGKALHAAAFNWRRKIEIAEQRMPKPSFFYIFQKKWLKFWRSIWLMTCWEFTGRATRKQWRTKKNGVSYAPARMFLEIVVYLCVLFPLFCFNRMDAWFLYIYISYNYIYIYTYVYAVCVYT